jgi:hypothetical protein
MAFDVDDDDYGDKGKRNVDDYRKILILDDISIEYKM